jgi:hypothetical protein
MLDGVEWIHLAQETDQWRALINTTMKLRVIQFIEQTFSRNSMELVNIMNCKPDTSVTENEGWTNKLSINAKEE